jgi:L-rhamnose-H+ transport protein
MIGIVLTGVAGRLKEKELSSAEKKGAIKEFNFVKGLLVAIFAGIMSACFAYGLASGKPIATLTKGYLLGSGRADLWQNLPVLVVVLLGGFTSNFIWSMTLILLNRTASEYLGLPSKKAVPETSLGAATSNPVRLNSTTLSFNYILSISTGLMWYFQFFFYSMGQTKMGKYDFSSWTLHMASIIIFSTMWGVLLKEWKGSSRRTEVLVGLGLAVLVLSTIVVGLGNYLKLQVAVQ